MNPGHSDAVSTSVMISLLALQAISEGWYKSDQASLEVTSKSGILLKRPGMRDLSVRITGPVTGGPYPLLVISHGMYGSETGLDPLVQDWAKHGYVVIQPTHDDSLRYADAETRRKAMAGSLDNIGSAPQRPKDIKLVLDSLAEIKKSAPALASKIDASRLGMGGHSFGAWTTQIVSGMSIRSFSPGKDDRFQAFLVISPQGLGGGITEASFKTMKSPMMMISGDNDAGRGFDDPKTYRRQAFENAARGEKSLVWIKNASHNFGGINGRSTRLPSPTAAGGRSNLHIRQVQSASLAFWDASLKKSQKAKSFLADKTLEKTGGVKIELK